MENKRLKFAAALLPPLKLYKKEKEEEGFIPTIELLIEDIERDIRENHDCKAPDACKGCEILGNVAEGN